ncbi:PREDICTED: putative gustatory receptor 28a [Wasmannia auropunctata]|uniref:putative gustatory receptor 28a n=1 Tax=Wasmannia auropunctata TaxID=64793 RepID=UPI0005F0783C|nr:PREDICTED: putative gustatory receptor 28a [Wasmannia auropunctata]
MFSSSSKLQTRANRKMRKRWRLFHATDFESLMYPIIIFCNILGLFPYKINALVIESSTRRYILSTVVICVCFICLLSILYMIDISGNMKYKGVPRTFERHCFYILSGLMAVVTYILSGPRMRLLQTIMEISSKLPSESYQKLSRLIHTKDIVGSFFVFIELQLLIYVNVHVVIKIFVIYVSLLTFNMDMLYMNCVCVLKACFKRINDNLEHMREFMMDDKVYHLGKMYQQRSLLLLAELKVLKKQHQTISNTVQMLNMVFSLQLLISIIITFGEITFQLYFHILYWQSNISMINVDDNIYTTFLTMSITYYFIKISLMVWACETGKDQALQIGTTVHDVLNIAGDKKIKSELQSFSLQILHRRNTFSAKGLTVGDRVESDHHPVEVRMRGEVRKREGGKGGNRGWRGVWDQKGRKTFKENLGKVVWKEGNLEREWEELEGKVREAMKEVEKERGKEEERREGWWDKECGRKKEKLRRELRK